jgi:predicted small secreted protein
MTRQYAPLRDGGTLVRSNRFHPSEDRQTTTPLGRPTAMRMTFSTAAAILILIGAIPLLGACHTTAGAGEDISATGHAITHSADKNTP